MVLSLYESIANLFRFNPHALPVMFFGLLALCFGLFVFMKNPASVINRRFFYFCLSIAFWLLPTSLGYLSVSETQAAWLFRIDNTSVLFISISVYRFVRAFLGLPSDWKDGLGYLAAVMVSALVLFTDTVVIGVREMSWGPYPAWGFGSVLPLTLFFAYMMGSFLLLFRALNRMEDEAQKNQAKYILIGYGIAYTGSVDYLGAFGFDVYPFGFLSIGLFFLIIGFAIIQHHLMEIEIVVRRATVFAGLFGFVYGTFALLTVLGQEYFEKSLGWPGWASLLPPILVITAVAKPLESYLTELTERYLFQQKYDYRELLKLFTGEVLTLLDVDQVMQNTASALDNIIKLELCAIYLRDSGDSGPFMLKAAQSSREALPAQMDPTHPLAAYLSNTHQPLRMSDQHRTDTLLEGARDFMKSLRGAICLPLVSRYRLIGFILLGTKKSGQTFTEGDVEVLVTLARTVAIAMTNAQLFSQVSAMQAEAAQKEKMAVIGTLSSGINHEICNPLGIIRGQCEVFLLNFKEGLYDGWPEKKVIEQAVTIFNKVIKETDRATAITKRLSTFAKPSKVFRPEAIEVVSEVREVMDILGHGLRVDNIRFAIELPEGFPKINCDRKQFQEVVFNILRNAAQSIGSSGLITVRAEVSGAGARILISDNGCGIPAEKIGKIFDPFFTTKDPGKGTGLGLFIVKQVVERNLGTISVASETGKGTTFTLTFPLAEGQMSAASQTVYSGADRVKVS